MHIYLVCIVYVDRLREFLSVHMHIRYFVWSVYMRVNIEYKLNVPLVRKLPKGYLSIPSNIPGRHRPLVFLKYT